MEYIVADILKKLGGLVYKCQKIRNDIPVDMKKGDARHVFFSGIQTSIIPLMLSFGALECSNQSIPNFQIKKICGLKGLTNKELLACFDTWAGLTLLIFTHFRLENLFSNLLSALDPIQKDKRCFKKIQFALFDLIDISDKNEKADGLKIISLLRNSLHNNSINKNMSFEKTIKGKKFVFIKNEPTTASIFDIIFLIDCTLDIMKEVINSTEILRIHKPIPELFHEKMGLT